MEKGLDRKPSKTVEKTVEKTITLLDGVDDRLHRYGLTKLQGRTLYVRRPVEDANATWEIEGIYDPVKGYAAHR